MTSTSASRPERGSLPHQGGSAAPDAPEHRLSLAERRTPIARLVVLIPTYDERENLPLVVERVRQAAGSLPGVQIDVMVLDDASPDGTGEVADALAAGDPHVHVMHRAGKAGLGAAYLAGFAWALEQGYDAVVEMDADGSHRPEHLGALLEAARDADLVIGSRWVPGGEVVDWPTHRRVLSVGANLYTKLAIGLPAMDATGGYRVYRATTLRSVDLDGVRSQGYCFQVDMTRRVADAGLTILEVPITFVEREIGVSKMSGSIIGEAFTSVARWGVQRRRRQLHDLLERRREGTWHSL